MREHEDVMRQCSGCYRRFAYYELDEYGECSRCEDERETERLEMERDELRQMMEDLG